MNEVSLFISFLIHICELSPYPVFLEKKEKKEAEGEREGQVEGVLKQLTEPFLKTS